MEKKLSSYSAITSLALRIFKRAKKAFRRLTAGKIRFDDSFGRWETAQVASLGYGDPSILARVLASTKAVLRNEAAFERDGVKFAIHEYSWPVASSLCLAAAIRKGKLDILDFGGSLGSTFFQYKPIHDTFQAVDWRIVEQPIWAATGSAEIQAKGLSFHESLEGALVAFKPAIAFMGSSLQYLKEPLDALTKIALQTASILVIDRIPLSYGEARIALQIVPKSIYAGSYPMHIFFLDDLLATLGTDWELFADYASVGGKQKTTSNFLFEWRGLVFRRKDITSGQAEAQVFSK